MIRRQSVVFPLVTAPGARREFEAFNGPAGGSGSDRMPGFMEDQPSNAERANGGCVLPGQPELTGVLESSACYEHAAGKRDGDNEDRQTWLKTTGQGARRTVRVILCMCRARVSGLPGCPLRRCWKSAAGQALKKQWADN